MNYYSFKTGWRGDLFATVFFSAIAARLALIVAPTVTAVAVVVALIVLPWWGYRLAQREVQIGAEGFVSVGVLRTTRFRWKDAYYRYVPLSDTSTGNGVIADAVVDCIKIIGRALLRRKRHVRTTFSVCSRDGRAFDLDHPEEPALEGEVIAVIERESDGETQPFTVEASGIRYRDKVLSFSELERVEVSDSVDVFRAGARIRWASVNLCDVHNLWLLVGRLLEHGVHVELRVDAPQAVLTAVARAKMNQAAIPRAEIIQR